MTHNPIFDAEEIAVFRDRVEVEMPEGQAEPRTAVRESGLTPAGVSSALQPADGIPHG